MDKPTQMENLLKLYLDTQTICSGTPDQYQYRHNLLLVGIAKYILHENLEEKGE